MLVAYDIKKDAYLVAEQNKDNVEIVSFLRKDGFKKLKTNVYSKYISYDELYAIYDEQKFCTYHDVQYTILGEDSKNYICVTTGAPKTIPKAEVTQIEIKKIPIYINTTV